jgi:hypothetical protein
MGQTIPAIGSIPFRVCGKGLELWQTQWSTIWLTVWVLMPKAFKMWDD